MAGVKRKAKSLPNIKPPKVMVKTEPKSEPNLDDTKLKPNQQDKDSIVFTCEVCDASFVTKMSLTRHMIYHENLQKHPCTICKMVFYKKDNLTKHFEKDHNGGKFVCKYCNRDMKSREYLLKHITNMHPEFLLEAMNSEALQVESKDVKPVIKIETPGPSTSNIRNIKQQQPKSIPTATVTKPSISTKIFEQPQRKLKISDDEDIQMNHGLNGYGDDFLEQDDPGDCDDTIRINASLNGIRVEKKHQCQECGATFMSYVNLHRHLATHTADRPHKCNMCGKGFVRKEHLTKHLSSVHSGMKFTCEFCGKDISRKDHLLRHIRNVHPQEFLGIPPEIVENQNMDLSPSSIQASGLQISELALKSFQPKPKPSYLTCDMCNETFTNFNELHEHQTAVHSDIRRFRCNFCPKSFKRKEHVRKHEVLHTGEKNFSCDTCGSKFPRKDALQDHIRRIHGVMDGQMDFPCNFCDKVFVSKINLIRHMRNIHKIMVELEGDEMEENSQDDDLDDDFEGEDEELDEHVGLEQPGNYQIVNDFLTRPPQRTSSSIVVNPIPYNGNGNTMTGNQISFFKNPLQSYSCGLCKAVFNDVKQFQDHLNTHRVR